jgi:hypothetical protein
MPSVRETHQDIEHLCDKDIPLGREPETSL